MRRTALALAILTAACAQPSPLTPRERLFDETTGCVVRVVVSDGFTEAERRSAHGYRQMSFTFVTDSVSAMRVIVRLLEDRPIVLFVPEQYLERTYRHFRTAQRVLEECVVEGVEVPRRPR